MWFIRALLCRSWAFCWQNSSFNVKSAVVWQLLWWTHNFPLSPEMYLSCWMLMSSESHKIAQVFPKNSSLEAGMSATVNGQLHSAVSNGSHSICAGVDMRVWMKNRWLYRALKIGCQNKEYPDKYGHYREAKYCQTKNHWFWKVCVFIPCLPPVRALWW